jgi:hypothetical protein
MTPPEWLALIAERAKELRAAGVRKVSMPELRLELDPYEPEPERSVTTEDQTIDIAGDSDPFNDPTTFGRRDGKLPGYKAANPRLGDDAT